MSADPMTMTTAYQRSALVAAAVETGIADAIAAGSLPADEVAAACRTHPSATLALLRALTAVGLAESSDSGFTLSPEGAPLARSHPRSLAEIVAKEWFFYRAWAGLPETVRDGHARIPPWRERLRTDPSTALAFLRALDDLAERFAGELPGLAGLDAPCRLLDVGGGAGSHAAALAAGASEVDATVLDLPECEPVLRERHPELAFVAGDLEEPRFGRPDGESWDAVLLANILHDHPPERSARYVAEAAGLLRPGGTLLVYEWLIGEEDPAPPQLAMFSLMMMVENEGGNTWTARQVSEWISAAGLEEPELRQGEGPISVLCARRPEGEEMESSRVAGASGSEED